MKILNVEISDIIEKLYYKINQKFKNLPEGVDSIASFELPSYDSCNYDKVKEKYIYESTGLIFPWFNSIFSTLPINVILDLNLFNIKINQNYFLNQVTIGTFPSILVLHQNVCEKFVSYTMKNKILYTKIDTRSNKHILIGEQTNENIDLIMNFIIDFYSIDELEKLYFNLIIDDKLSINFLQNLNIIGFEGYDKNSDSIVNLMIKKSNCNECQLKLNKYFVEHTNYFIDSYNKIRVNNGS